MITLWRHSTGCRWPVAQPCILLHTTACLASNNTDSTSHLSTTGCVPAIDTNTMVSLKTVTKPKLKGKYIRRYKKSVKTNQWNMKVYNYLQSFWYHGGILNIKTHFIPTKQGTGRSRSLRMVHRLKTLVDTLQRLLNGSQLTEQQSFVLILQTAISTEFPPKWNVCWFFSHEHLRLYQALKNG